MDCDDHDVHALTCLGLINSPKGRAMKNGTAQDQKAFKTIRLHFIEHTTAAAKKKAQQQASAMAGFRKAAVTLGKREKTCRPKKLLKLCRKLGYNPIRAISRHKTKPKR